MGSAPGDEEGAKALALLFVIRRRPGFLDGVHDGIVYAAWVALGFATVENVLYYAEAWSGGGAEDLTITFVLRGLMTPLCHPIFTAMTGIALGLAVKRRGWRGWRIALVAVGLLLAILLHALWNLSATIGSAPIAYVAGYLPLALGLAVWTKRLLIGRYEPTRVAVWSGFFLRHWLVQRTVAAGQLEAAVAETVEGVLAGSPLAARLNKRNLRMLSEQGGHYTDAQLDASFAFFQSADYPEGMAAFLAKRKPEFRHG